VEVHQVVYHTTLQVVLNLIDDDLLPHVDQLDVGEVPLILVDCLIDLFVVADTVAEIGSRLLWVLAHVVRRSRLHFQNVGHDQVFVVAFRLHE
jgi:hypothetical protein